MSDIYGPRRTTHAYPTGHCWQRCAAVGCAGFGEPGRHGQPSFCAIHLCKKPNCGDGRDNGSAYCLRHACDITTCSHSKLDTSAFCNQHACQYSGCKSSKRGAMTLEGVTSEACEDHICQSNSCVHTRRHHRPFCKEHSCGWSGRVTCNQEVQTGSRACRDHVCQFEGGCLNVRKVKTNGQACDDHTCRISNCYKTVGIRGKYCRDHTCIWEPCSQRGRYMKSPYCDTHKCQTPECTAAVASKIDSFCSTHKCQYGNGECLSGWKKAPPFCEEHVCSVKGCHAPVGWGGNVCMKHAHYQSPEPKKSTPVASHKKKDSKSTHEPYIEESDPASCPCSDHEDHVAHHQSNRKAKKGSKGEDDLHESSNGVLVRRGDLQVATAVHGDVAVRPDIMSYAVARRAGKKVPPPDVFRTDPNYALAYGCGMQDAMHLMADMWKSGAFAQVPATQGGQFASQAAFVPGGFTEMDRHLPTFEGQRIIEEEGG